MLQRVTRTLVPLFLLVASALLGACSPRIWAGDPTTTGDPPTTTRATTAAVNVPFCDGGSRAKGCLFGENCRVTEKDCQVCQCLPPP